MFEMIFRFIFFMLEEVLIEGIFAIARYIGLLSLKLITLSSKPIEQLNRYYKDSSKPYFLGFGIIAGIIYLIAQYA